MRFQQTRMPLALFSPNDPTTPEPTPVTVTVTVTPYPAATDTDPEPEPEAAAPLEGELIAAAVTAAAVAEETSERAEETAETALTVALTTDERLAWLEQQLNETRAALETTRTEAAEALQRALANSSLANPEPETMEAPPLPTSSDREGEPLPEAETATVGEVSITEPSTPNDTPDPTSETPMEVIALSGGETLAAIPKPARAGRVRIL